ncbi:MAG: LexA repressor [Candidatus Parcubacteria bacterium]|jgi:repressor LexA
MNTSEDTQHAQELIEYYKRNKRMPSYSEMMKLFGYKSKNAVFKLVEKFIEAGIVLKDSVGKLIPNNLFDEVPLLGSVKAGFPSDVTEVRDSMNLEDFLIDKSKDSYILEVDGDSMIDAHIADGDMVVVERTNRAKDGDIVVAEIDGEWTMKYWREKGSKAWLEPANKAFKPMYPEQSLRVAAKVKAVIRKY